MGHGPFVYVNWIPFIQYHHTLMITAIRHSGTWHLLVFSKLYLLSFNIFSDINFRMILFKENISARPGSTHQEPQNLRGWHKVTKRWVRTADLSHPVPLWPRINKYCSPGLPNSSNPSVCLLSAGIVEKKFLINVTSNTFLPRVVHAFHLSTGKAEEGRSLEFIPGQPVQTEKPCPKNQKKNYKTLL